MEVVIEMMMSSQGFMGGRVINISGHGGCRLVLGSIVPHKNAKIWFFPVTLFGALHYPS